MYTIGCVCVWYILNLFIPGNHTISVCGVQWIRRRCCYGTFKMENTEADARAEPGLCSCPESVPGLRLGE